MKVIDSLIYNTIGFTCSCFDLLHAGHIIMWFHIKALDPGINKVLTFWLGADSREDLDKILKKKQITQIEWVREEIPPFI